MHKLPPTPAARPNGRAPERRAFPRKQRAAKVLFLPDDSVLDEPFRGWLVNASRGGLRLSIGHQDIGEGALLMVRPPSAPAGTPWLLVKVRNRRLQDNSCELGCQFLRGLSPETLQLF